MSPGSSPRSKRIDRGSPERGFLRDDICSYSAFFDSTILNFFETILPDSPGAYPRSVFLTRASDSTRGNPFVSRVSIFLGIER